MVKNIFHLNNDLIVTLDDGTEYKTNQCTDEFYNKVKSAIDNNEDLESLFYPENFKKKKFKERCKKSSLLTIKNNSAYMLSVSKLTVPQMLVENIVEAEERNDTDALIAYKNFWTLLSLNPNSAVRDNLFWFLTRWGMSICKSGLFVAYRNVELKSEGTKYNQKLTEFVSENYYKIKNDNKNPEDFNVYSIENVGYYITNKNSNDLYIGNLKDLYESIVFTSDEAGTVYTDNYTGKMEIRLGHVVSMPRSEVDETQISCSRGLHVSYKGWLKYNYCGNIGLKVLVNPANVCSVPREDNYGKMRTCAYYPIQVIKFDSNGDIIDETVPDGFEVDFLEKICYTGDINNEDNDNYKLELPVDIKNVELVYNNLRNIASTINRRV